MAGDWERTVRAMAGRFRMPLRAAHGYVEAEKTCDPHRRLQLIEPRRDSPLKAPHFQPLHTTKSPSAMFNSMAPSSIC